MEPLADDLPRAATRMLGAACLFAGMGVTVKIAAQSLPNATVVFYRNAIGLAALLPWLLGEGKGVLRTRHFREHMLRGLAGLGAMYCFFFALSRLRLADAVLLNYSLPLFMPFVESLWLREPFPRRLWGPIGLGFGGILLVLKPGLGLFQPAALVGLAAALFASVAQVGIRNLTRTEPVTRIVFYFSVISTTASALPVVVSWRLPPAGLWGTLLAMGVLATLAQLLLTRAYSYAPAARVGPFIYSAVAFAGLFDWLLWSAVPDALSIVGIMLVAAAGIFALRLRGR